MKRNPSKRKPATPPADLHSVNALSRITGRDRRTLDKVLVSVKPAGMRSGKPVYRLEDVQRALNSQGRGESYAELRAEQIRQQTRESAARAEILEMERLEKQRELVTLSDVQSMFSQALLPVRQRLLALPSECCSRCNPTDPLFAQAALQAWVDAALPMIREQLPAVKGKQ